MNSISELLVKKAISACLERKVANKAISACLERKVANKVSFSMA
jgi:hypothetical protein